MSTRKATKKVNKARIYRAVASSSAIDSGQPVRMIELRLKNCKRHFPRLTLAD